MRNWLLASLYAAMAAALTLWVEPTDTLGADFLSRSALLLAPMRAVRYFECRVVCRLAGLGT